MQNPEELPLPGGRLTAGVVRIGNTVRRPAKPSSGFVARLLAQLEAQGCPWAPRYLGRDELDRDALSYLPGHTPPKWTRFADGQLRAAVLIVKQLHDATRGSLLASTGVVCHNDPGPNNFVFSDEGPVAIIDFDLAEPGQELEDLGYMAWSWCLSSKPERGPIAAQVRQVRVLADAYGLNASDRELLPEWIVERQLRNARFWSERLADPVLVPTSPAKMREVIEWSKREAHYTQAHRSELLAALRD
jgi:Ser/Thr protein kinase RdoA (MazF antagonist)